MPNNLNNIVYLSEAQRTTLFTNGTITVDGVTITYSDNDLYVTPSNIDTTPTSNSYNLITSGAVYTGLSNKQNTISTSGILKGDGAGGVSAAVAGTDYQPAVGLSVVNGKVCITYEEE